MLGHTVPGEVNNIYIQTLKQPLSPCIIGTRLEWAKQECQINQLINQPGIHLTDRPINQPTNK